MRAGLARVEVEEPRELSADAGDVRVDLLGRQQHPLLRLAARIADHPGAAADDRNRPVSESLQARERHHRQQAADVQTRRGRIEPDIRRHLLGREHPGQPFGRVEHQAAPRELFEQICHLIAIYYISRC